MDIKSKIFNLFKERKELSINEILDEISVSRQFIHRVLNDLMESNFIEKFGKSPKTIYKIKEASLVPKTNYGIIESSEVDFLDHNFLLITEIGKMLSGLEAFENWCIKRNLPIEKTINEYIETKKKYNAYFDKNNLISGIEKLKNTKGYDKIYLDELYYLDFYAIERFGKTRLGTILHYAKQGQNKMLMRILIDEIKEPINKLIVTLKIDAIAYVPPTIKRETQLMKVLMNGIKINKPQIEIIKIGGIIPVPQKSLNKLEERISNAENTFVVKGNVTYKNVLLIDDAVGSGSTLNQISGKLKNKKIAENVIGLAIVGSFKGFDVITDV